MQYLFITFALVTGVGLGYWLALRELVERIAYINGGLAIIFNEIRALRDGQMRDGETT
jgi:hypothetical protein